VSDFTQWFIHAESIKQKYKHLVVKLEVKNSGVLNQLLANEVINEREKERISSQATSYEQNEELLSLLKRKTKNHFDKFLHALDATGQSHIRRYIEDRTANAEERHLQ